MITAAVPRTPRVSPTAPALSASRFGSDLRRFLAFAACLAGGAHILSGSLALVGDGIASGLRAFLALGS